MKSGRPRYVERRRRIAVATLELRVSTVYEGVVCTINEGPSRVSKRTGWAERSKPSAPN